MTANNYFRTGDKGVPPVVETFDDHSKEDTRRAFNAVKAFAIRVIAWRPPKCSGPWDFGVGYVGRGPVNAPGEGDED